MEESLSENLLAPISAFPQRCFVLGGQTDALAFSVLSAHVPLAPWPPECAGASGKAEVGVELAPPLLSGSEGKGQPSKAEKVGDDISRFSSIQEGTSAVPSRGSWEIVGFA